MQKLTAGVQMLLSRPVDRRYIRWSERERESAVRSSCDGGDPRSHAFTGRTDAFTDVASPNPADDALNAVKWVTPISEPTIMSREIM